LLRFFSFNDTINALAPFFWKNNVKCFELSLVMQQTNTQFIKNLNKQSLEKFNILIQIIVDKYQTF